jgi:uncharacterized protein (TIGR00290 family)
MSARALLAWSGGKDSAWALHMLRAGGVDVAALFTTVHDDRVAIHAVRRALLEEQARALGVPLHQLAIPRDCPNAVYERTVGEFVQRMKGAGVTHVAFGDLFLEDIRRYRESQFASSGVDLLFPLWARPTRALAQEMVASGLRAWITCVDTTQAPAEWAGRVYDAQFLPEVTPPVDPCGENGEFHTFVFEGPMLRRPLATALGRCSREGRWAYADIVPRAAE